MAKLIEKKAKRAGFIWLLAGALGQNSLQIIMVLVLARTISPSDFGVVSIAVAIIAFLRVFAEVGIGPSLVQKKEISEIDIATANSLALFLGVVIAISIYLSASKIASYFVMPELELVLKLMCLMLPFSALSIVGQSVLQRRLKFKKITVYTFISFVLGYGFIALSMAYMGYGIWSLVFAYLTQTGILYFILTIKLNVMRIYNFNIRSAVGMLRFGVGYSIARVFNFLAGQGDNLLIGKIVGSEALGIYGRAYQIMSMPAILFGSVIDKFFFPILSSAQDNLARLEEIYLNSIGVTLLVFVPLSMYIYFFSFDIVMILFGSSWLEMVDVIKVMALGLYFRIGYKFSDVLIISIGKVYGRAFIQVVFAMSMVISVLAGTNWGLNGAAAGVVFAIFVNYIFMAILVYRNLRFSVKQFLLSHFKFFLIPLLFFYINNAFLRSDGEGIDLHSFLLRSFLYFASVFVFFVVFNRVFRNELLIAKKLIVFKSLDG